MWIRSLMKYEPAAAIYLLRFDITSQVVRGREGYANRIFLYCSMGAPWERLMFFFLRNMKPTLGAPRKNRHVEPSLIAQDDKICQMSVVAEMEQERPMIVVLFN